MKSMSPGIEAIGQAIAKKTGSKKKIGSANRSSALPNRKQMRLKPGMGTNAPTNFPQ